MSTCFGTKRSGHPPEKDSRDLAQFPFQRREFYWKFFVDKVIYELRRNPLPGNDSPDLATPPALPGILFYI